MRRAGLVALVLLVAPSCEQSTEPEELSPTFVPNPQTWYGLQTVPSAQVSWCLEGNGFDPGSVLAGAAFMGGCLNVTGQLWKFVPEGDGLYRMTTYFQDPEGKCLDGHGPDSDELLGGAAYMDDCRVSSTQLWAIEPVVDRYFQLRTVDGGVDRCLDGNLPDPGSEPEGGVYLDACNRRVERLWLATER